MLTTLIHIEEVAFNTKTFLFRPENAFDYVAGQFIEMILPHSTPDARGQKHWFSLSSSPTEELIGITTKQAKGLSSTFKRTLFALTPGAQVNISEPMGDFVLPKDKTIPLVFVAGGMGITPVRSMVKWLLDASEKRDIHIIYAEQLNDSYAFREVFEDYGARLDLILTGGATNPNARIKKIDGKLIVNTVAMPLETIFFVSGPEPMVERLEIELQAVGIDKNRLVLDYFPGYPTL